MGSEGRVREELVVERQLRRVLRDVLEEGGRSESSGKALARGLESRASAKVGSARARRMVSCLAEDSKDGSEGLERRVTSEAGRGKGRARRMVSDLAEDSEVAEEGLERKVSANTGRLSRTVIIFTKEER